MAPVTTEEGNRRWIRRFRRKRSQTTQAPSAKPPPPTEPSADGYQPRHTSPEHGDRVKHRPGRPKIPRSRTECSMSKSKNEVLPKRLEKKIYMLAETSGNMKRMSVELDTHQRCVSNLAATVVRQNHQIRELQRHIKELVGRIEAQESATSGAESGTDGVDGPCSAYTSTDSEHPTESDFSKEHAERETDSLMDRAELHAVLDEARAMMQQSQHRKEDRQLPKDVIVRHIRASSHSGDFR